jgi:hypothetical protein
MASKHNVFFRNIFSNIENNDSIIQFIFHFLVLMFMHDIYFNDKMCIKYL